MNHNLINNVLRAPFCLIVRVFFMFDVYVSSFFADSATVAMYSYISKCVTTNDRDIERSTFVCESKEKKLRFRSLQS